MKDSALFLGQTSRFVTLTIRLFSQKTKIHFGSSQIMLDHHHVCTNFRS